MTGPFQAALFDFGGTLFSYGGMGADVIALVQRSAERLGVQAELTDLGRAYREASRAAYQEFAPRPFYLHRELFHDTFRRFASILGSEVTEAYLDWFHEELRRLLLDRFALRADCMETLRELRGRGLHIGVVSNIDDDYLLPMLSRAGLDEVLDAWTSSEEAESCKPDAEIFRYALAKADADPEEVVFIGDSLEHDVAGARNLGMTTVWIREAGSSAPGAGVGETAEPHHVIESLSELVSLLEAGCARR